MVAKPDQPLFSRSRLVEGQRRRICQRILPIPSLGWVLIDTDCDFRDDARGRDFDQHSPNLRRYHQILWSKPLPDGSSFELDATGVPTKDYLVTPTGLVLASDQLINTMTTWKDQGLESILASIPEEEQESFRHKAATIGAVCLWPKRAGPARQTINQARGMNAKIKDRLDLTLECIRLHYAGQSSPLSAVLDDAGEFFGLWPSWRSWMSWWFFDDLVDGNGEVRWLLPFSGFDSRSAKPQSVEEWRRYRHGCIEFVDRRAERMATHARRIVG